jgi:hypothetical protein
MFLCVDVDLYLFLRSASVHKNRFLFRSSSFLKTIIELSSSSFVSLLISKSLLLSFNELLDIIIREVVSTCDEIWELFCKKVSWERDARTESFVIDALTEKSLTDESFWDRSFVDDAFLDSDSLTKWFLNLLNVDSIVLDVWYSSV